jgi:hypothetical protein
VICEASAAANETLAVGEGEENSDRAIVRHLAGDWELLATRADQNAHRFCPRKGFLAFGATRRTPVIRFRYA